MQVKDAPGASGRSVVTVEPRDTIADVVDLYEPLAQEKDICVHSWQHPGLSCEGDRDLLFQMVANLLDNAVKYTPRGGNISVVVESGPGGRPRVSVTDSGPGIPEADRENVFQRFFRLESSRGEHPGSGLGLSLVKAVVAMHRGTVELLDARPGLRVEVSLGYKIEVKSDS